MNAFNRQYNKFIKGLKNDLIVSQSNLVNMKQINVITEDVFKDEEFLKLFEYVMNFERDMIIMRPFEIAEYFPLKSKIRKGLCKRFFKKYLYISILKDLSTKEIIKHLKFWTKLDEDNDELKSTLNEILDSFATSDAIFYIFENDDKGLMFILRDECEISDFRHEFIHYWHWAKNEESDIIINSTTLLKNNELLKKFIDMFQIPFDVIDYFCGLEEYEPLMNDAISELKDLKNRNFNELSQNEYHNLILNSFFYKWKKDTKFTYLEKLKNSQFFNFIMNSHYLQYIVFCVLIDYNMLNIKNHICSVI